LSVNVSLPNGMIVSCHQKHEVALVQLEVQSYFGNGLQLNAGDTVFDVGANIGLFSLAAYEHCDRDLRIFAFEPVAAIFELLKANCERNTAKRQVSVFCCGLSHRAGLSRLAYYPRAPVLSTAYPDPDSDLQIIKDIVANRIIYLAEAPFALRCLRWLPAAMREPLIGCVLKRALVSEIATCEMRTLSEVVSEYGVARIDLLKVDVEKSELDVLEGISAADWPKIQQVVVEVHDLDRRVERTKALLVAAGMRSTVVDQPLTLKNSNIFTIFATRHH
jgi:FkbM family methyltransferase